MMGINFESRKTVLERSKQNKAIEMGLFFFWIAISSWQNSQ